jgi:hypothetical protein
MLSVWDGASPDTDGGTGKAATENALCTATRVSKPAADADAAEGSGSDVTDAKETPADAAEGRDPDTAAGEAAEPPAPEAAVSADRKMAAAAPWGARAYANASELAYDALISAGAGRATTAAFPAAITAAVTPTEAKNQRINGSESP